MKNKKTFLIVFGIIVLGLTAYTLFIELNQGRVTVEEKVAVTKNEDGANIEETIIEIDEKKVVALEEEMPELMTEYAVQDAIHAMSHQKVKADEKWGFLPLTQDRVKRLIEVVEKNEKEYNHSNIYLDILRRWEKSDFSSVDKDHNAIWELQGGTIGKAYGILSPEEEKAFIRKHFNIVEKPSNDTKKE
ncbi:DUF6241 domain-containing protein [Bacillus sp. FJAT-50079]|uniref:DUF6241 domain-containing protein n=1 Tax=Bacillus sp. FJAT-50079 TaxID=2833577 RepID=UPI001BC9A3BD|nr:DUF6241 domain-containing protein [Bacillus sp. FJAT-50079]MBS4206555.1 hypothetical protein [Bacillus sp. FJAT-50079]